MQSKSYSEPFRFLSGAVSFYILEYSSSEGTKSVYLFGDVHLSWDNMCFSGVNPNRPLFYLDIIKSCNSRDDCKYIGTFIEELLMNATPDNKVAFLYESSSKEDMEPEQIKEFVQDTRKEFIQRGSYKRPVGGPLRHVKNYYAKCAYLKQGCPKNVEFLPVDKRIFAVPKLYEIEDGLLIGRIPKDIFSYIESLNLDDLLLQSLERLGIKFNIPSELKRKLFDWIGNSVENLMELQDKIINRKASESVFETVFNLVFGFNNLIMDINTLVQLFSSEATTIIIYAGENHIDTYVKFLKSLEETKILLEIPQKYDPDQFMEDGYNRCLELPVSY